MAYTKAQLEALNAALLASNQPIPAVKHRQFNQAEIDEMYDAQTRGNLLFGVQTTVSLADDDTVLVLKTNGQAYRIKKSDLIVGFTTLTDRGFWSTNETMPSTGGSGAGGAIRKHDRWYVPVGVTWTYGDTSFGEYTCIEAMIDGATTYRDFKKY